MNKLFPDFEYLSVLRGNGTAIEGPTAERTGMGDYRLIDITRGWRRRRSRKRDPSIFRKRFSKRQKKDDVICSILSRFEFFFTIASDCERL